MWFNTPFLFKIDILSFYHILGPLSATLVDMWRMIWQDKVQRIVMVTRLNEATIVRLLFLLQVKLIQS